MRKVLNSSDRNARDLRPGLKMQSKTTEGFPATGAKSTTTNGVPVEGRAHLCPNLCEDPRQ